MPRARENRVHYVRVESPGDVPPAAERTIDVALLDMNHGWPNLGHDCLVLDVLAASDELARIERQAGIRVRVLSFDVRRSGIVPESPGGRFSLYVGTGGPGQIDPHHNDGAMPGSQGIHEDPAWEEPLFQLFDAVLADETAALLAVCHTFGVLCRWAGIAQPTLRGPEKGGKSTGVLENLLTSEARLHPWFGRLAGEPSSEGRLRILDNRLFDLIPGPRPFPSGTIPIGYEALGVGGPRGDALTMVEFARDRGGAMPRVFAVNHHPEILNRAQQSLILEEKVGRGEVTREWADERREILTRSYPDEDSDRELEITSELTLLGPLRFHLYRQLRLRAEALGLPLDLHEDRVAAEPRVAASRPA
ncbi:MAG: hypothetical protein M3O15_04505 [Acidobacteriota bacterium]|nr:hypothetical protein [Acidobacteriota bacterium]